MTKVRMRISEKVICIFNGESGKKEGESVTLMEKR